MKADIEKEFLSQVVPDKQRSIGTKRINGKKKKGNRGELDCVNILKKRFPGKIFSRTMGSGNYTGGKNAYHAKTLTEEQILLFAGDIRCPKEFKFCIEHKFYAKIDFYDLFNKSSDLYKWYEQSETDAKLLNKFPLLIVKTNQHKRIVFVKIEHASKKLKPVFVHEGRCCYWLEDFLTLSDEYFFD